jgi:hypothetical protein
MEGKWEVDHEKESLGHSVGVVNDDFRGHG